jgi:hypothetical protein
MAGFWHHTHAMEAHDMTQTLTRLMVLETVKGLGLRAQWSRDYATFVVDYRQDDPRFVPGDHGTSYHTPDPQDAMDTARAMAKWVKP